MHRDLIDWREVRAPLEIARTTLPKSSVEALERTTRQMLAPNYRWLR